MNHYTLEVKYNEETDDYFIEFPQEALDQVGWNPGDVIEWKDNGDGSFTLQKKVDNETSDEKAHDSADGAAQS